MLVALTGGMGSGKSTVKRLLLEAQPSFESFDADSCVHQLLSEDTDIIASVVEEFGNSILRPDGTVCRSALRQIVFADAGKRRNLEALLHPAVRQQWQTRLARCRENGGDFLAEIPLLFETNAGSSFDVTLTVACSPEVQHARLSSRGLEPATAQAMLASQLPMVEKVRRADLVVWNDGTVAALDLQIHLLLQRLFPD